MKAVVFRAIKDIGVEEVPEPRIENPDDVIIRVGLSAICASDLHIKNDGLHKPGRILGHEYCGVIEEVGKDVRSFKKGDKVVGKPFANCGYCYYCSHGQPELCDNGILFGVQGGQGVQAEYARIPWPENTLKKVPDGLSYEDVIFVGDNLSTGLTGILRSRLDFGETVAIFGTGPVGLCAVALANLYGASKIVAVDILDYRLDVAKQFGALTVNALKKDAVASIKELTGGKGVDVGIEAAGFETTFNDCLKSVRKGGRMSVVGLFTKPTYFNISDRFFDVFNFSIGLGDSSHMEELISLIEAEKLNVKPLITHRMALQEAMEGYRIFENKLDNCIKVLLKI